MAFSAPCHLCTNVIAPGFEDAEIRPLAHYHGTADQTTPGVLGGFVCSCPCRHSPAELHGIARAQHPNDKDAAGRRYIELMREAGHIVDRDPDDNRPLLPCGWDPRGRGQGDERVE